MRTSQQIITAVTEQNRAKGMLVIVNSFASEQSDAKRIARQLQQAPYARQIDVGLLASEVLRDPRRRVEYHQMLERWMLEKRRYVLIATSVVEMGVTLPDLDFIVTMDSGFDDSADTGKLGRVALGTNALIQRFGRVGRVRPGIAYITREVGAPYSDLDDSALNATDALTPQPIAFPMASGPLTWLAHETLVRGWQDADLAANIASLRLPTPMPDGSERYSQLRSERVRLWGLGVRYGDESDIGKYLERWIGRADLDSALEARNAFQKQDAKALINALCSYALSAVPMEAVYPTRDGVEQVAATETAIKVLRAYAFEAICRWSYRFDAKYATRELLEDLWEALLERGAREDLFLKQVTALAEAFDILREACADDPHLQLRLKSLSNWRDALRDFVKIES